MGLLVHLDSTVPGHMVHTQGVTVQAPRQGVVHHANPELACILVYHPCVQVYTGVGFGCERNGYDTVGA